MKLQMMGRPSWQSPFLDDPDANFSVENCGEARRKKKVAKKKEKRACGN
jgi:hypothetical protein